MAAQSVSVFAEPTIGSVDAALAHIVERALTPWSACRVGLELEFHLVDVGRPERRISWAELGELRSRLPVMPGGSRVTVEPGGQLELSTPPASDVVSAVAALRRDRRVLSGAAGTAGLGLASIGADPARPVRRLNPASRYVAMERHFDAVGCGPAGRAMMSATAALQVNVDAGPRASWARRMRRIHSLGPVLVALSACSPLLAGHASGWRSMRQQVWGEIDQARCGPLRGGHHPAEAWASYALAAPLMLLRDPVSMTADPVTARVSFADWVTGASSLTRAPTFSDLDYHLSTLFPPVRPRGFIEIRCLDAVPNRWWPALAALTVTLLDDEVAADLAEEACEPVADHWATAARDALSDRSLALAARRCAEIAARRCPIELRPEVEAYAELVSRRRTPGDDLRELATRSGPLAVLEEEAHA
jgi:ergothioneine biosynthesis glutamate--cysteine ligase EgtA